MKKSMTEIPTTKHQAEDFLLHVFGHLISGKSLRDVMDNRPGCEAENLVLEILRKHFD